MVRCCYIILLTLNKYLLRENVFRKIERFNKSAIDFNTFIFYDIIVFIYLGLFTLGNLRHITHRFLSSRGIRGEFGELSVK